MDTVESWTNLLWSNKIYTYAVCGSFSGSPSDKTEAFIFKREVPGLALVKPNDLLMVKLEELHRIWNNSNCLPKWLIVREIRMVSRTHFLTEFDLHLVDLTFVPKVHKGVQMGLRGIDESLFPVIAPRLICEFQRPRIWSDLGYFWMICTVFLISYDLIDFLIDSLASFEGLKSTGISYQTNDMLFRTRKYLRYLGELGYDTTLM
jgi:hypothetical protein